MNTQNDIPIDFKKLSKEPTFKNTGLDSPITEFALAMTAHKDDKYYASGSAIIIGKNLAITAQHVIDDFFREFEGSYIDVPPDSEVAGTFHLQLCQILNNGKSGRIWNVTRLWVCNFSDIAVLRLSPTTQEALEYKWRLPKMDLIPPEVGERVSCFGYRKPQITKTENQIEWQVDSKTSIGEVKAVHDQKRDSCRLPFPCFQTNARYDGAMSGGPVFKDTGKLCGIICSNLPPSSDGEDHVSYVTSLWPLMGLKIDIDRKGHPKNIKYPMLELARDNFIHADGWERIILVPDQYGNIIQVYLKRHNKANSADAKSRAAD